MNPAPANENSKDEKEESPDPAIKRLYAQIRKMPELTKQAQVVDQVLSSRRQDLKMTASDLISQFHEQKKFILQRFDSWIMPIAQDVLDGFLQDAQHMKRKLEDKLEHIDQMTAEEWDQEAQHWAHLYSKWNDRKGLVNTILEVVADRTKHLIDKDLQVVQDYQTQSLAHIPPETEDFRNLEERLEDAIEEPLKQLMSLRTQVEEHKSLQQASEWISKLQEKRETYFNQLLMKIDHVMKDVVNLEETNDWTGFVEVEGEILFMERELHHINSDLTHLHLLADSDRQFLLGRLEGLLDHVQDLENRSLPSLLKDKMKALQSGVLFAISRIEKSH